MSDQVRFSVPERPLAYKDIEFNVFNDEGKLGELRVSQGGVVWVPKDCTYGYKMNWSKFAKLMAEQGNKGYR